MIPIRHSPGVTTPGQLGPTRRSAEPRSAARARTMSSTGMPSVMQIASAMPASAASRIASAAPGGGTKITEASAPVSTTALRTVSKSGMPSASPPPLPGATPATTCVPYSRESRAWKTPIRPMPWTSRRVSLPQRIATLGPPAAGRGDDPLPGLAQRVRRRDVELRLREDAAALPGVRALEPHDQRHLDRELLGRGDDSLGDQVAAHDAPEDVDEDRAHVRIAQDQLERLLHLLLVGAAAGVEEVRRAPAAVLDHVERRHREARAVHHAADVAVEPDVGEVDLLRLALARVLLLRVAQLGEVGVAVERVVVEVELGVEREQVGRLRHDQRVDLRERGVLLDEEPEEPAEQRLELLHLRRVEPEPEADPPGDVAGQRRSGVDHDGDDLLGAARGDLLDLDAPLGRCDHRELLALAVDDDRKVELARDLRAGLDVDLAHEPALRAGLVAAQRHAENLGGDALRLGGRLRELDPPGLAAAAGVDLRLHDDDARVEPPRDLLRLGGRRRELAGGDGDSVRAQEPLGLVLVDVHRRICSTRLRTCCTEASKSFCSSWSSSTSITRSSPPAPSTAGTPT